MDSRNQLKTICFDLDGTLCTNTFGDYECAEPLTWAIARVNALADAGHRIVVFTARGTATGIDWDAVTRSQLERWGVRYHELRFGKPSADVYVDDRAVHTDAWLSGDAFAPPGFPRDGAPGASQEEIPVVPPPPLSCVVEHGRTYGGCPHRLHDHAERAIAAAGAAGIPAPHRAEDVARRVRAALAAGSVRPGDDVVYSIAVAAPGHAAQLDAGPAALATVSVSCRPLSECARGLGGAPALTATTDGSGDWPLRTLPDGTLGDSLGGLLGIVRGRSVAVEQTPLAGVALGWLRTLAPRCGLSLTSGPLSRDDLIEADEAFVAGIPFCVLPIAAVDTVDIGAGAPGPATSALLGAWSAEAGIDVARQLAALATAPEVIAGV